MFSGETNTSRENLMSILSHNETWLENNVTIIFDETTEQCEEPVVFQGLIYQVANMIFLVSYLIPSDRRGKFFMHCTLLLGYLLYSVWTWNVLKSSEIFGWGFSFMVINGGQSLFNAYKLRPVIINKEMESVYVSLFESLSVSRHLFKKLMSIEFAQTMSLHTGEAYAMCDLTKTDRLGLLISGKAIAISDGNFLHAISPMEFLDSPEFDSSRTTVENKFKVSIVASETCRYIFWQRSSLEYLFVKDPYLCTVMSALIAKDITQKLFNMNQSILTEDESTLDIRLPSLASCAKTNNPMLKSG